MHRAVQNPYAIETLERHGYFWTGGRPRGLDGLPEQDWDFVITVCDRAKEACPILVISRRIDLFLALPIEKLSRLALESRVKDIGQTGTVEPTAGAPSSEATWNYADHQ
jgi:protein-tyrosine-phosphatase